ncbi:hypothetical protein [Effusibacillus lacus]|uniref:Uncharacterized protein n=1 Tax=Effusibacillus lacus TaxID=1348429 RepID=A0A292YJH3_9BACL|nr:hypothetical protein [Effusibacillus lacus]TCS76928.1 hypothetical protein EDD64_101152 [Effusibacillus lacus]GAX91257.1 hypothetical protein EFBL_2923 [Effusibacillus lacus]
MEEMLSTILSEMRGGFAQVYERLDKIETRIDKIEARIDKIEARMYEIERQLHSHQKMIASNTETLDQIKAIVQNHSLDITMIKKVLCA